MIVRCFAAALTLAGLGFVMGSVALTATTAAMTSTTVSNTERWRLPGRGISGSSITVPAGLGSLQRLSVTFNALTHYDPYTLVMTLHGPRGQQVHLSGDTGGTIPVSNLTYSFDDAGTTIPTPMIAGTYRPLTVAGLATFNGPDPGGTWRVVIAIGPPTVDGEFAGGWSMTLTTSAFPESFTFSDPTLTPGITVIKAAHVTQLRAAVNTIRVRNGLAASSFADPTPSLIRALHITELRQSLSGLLTDLGRVGPGYTDTSITATSTVIQAAHVQELRSAVREADVMRLSVTRSGSGTGTVVSNPSGIRCSTDCADAYPPNTLVTLTAAAATGSTFGGWGGSCAGTDPCLVTTDAAKAVTATFINAPIALTVVKAGSGTGTVIGYPAGINCGTACTQNFVSGSTVTLYANPSAGSSFTGWSGACTGIGACELTMTATTQVTATFGGYTTSTYDVQPQYAFLGVSGGCNGGVLGQQFTITAPAGTTWSVSWTGSDVPPSSHAGSLNKTSGSGADSVVFTITVASQTPAPGRTCANIIDYDFADTFFFSFYSNGVKVAEVVTRIEWVYHLVS